MARRLGVRVTMHVGVTTAKIRGITKLNEQKLLGPDITYVHPTGISDDEFKMISATGGTLSSAPVAEMMSQGNFPDVQKWLSFGLRPSLPQNLALANAPDADGTFFKVPKVIER